MAKPYDHYSRLVGEALLDGRLAFWRGKIQCVALNEYTFEGSDVKPCCDGCEIPCQLRMKPVEWEALWGGPAPGVKKEAN